MQESICQSCPTDARLWPHFMEASCDCSICTAALCKLLTLELANCGIGARESGALQVIGRLARMTVLEVRGNSLIGDTGMQRLATALASGSLNSLKKLRFEDCEVGPAGCSALCEGIGGIVSIEELVLRHNRRIGDMGAHSLGELLSANTTLAKLDLAQCGIGADGCSALCRGVVNEQMLLLVFALAQTGRDCSSPAHMHV